MMKDYFTATGAENSDVSQRVDERNRESYFSLYETSEFSAPVAVNGFLWVSKTGGCDNVRNRKISFTPPTRHSSINFVEGSKRLRRRRARRIDRVAENSQAEISVRRLGVGALRGHLSSARILLDARRDRDFRAARRRDRRAIAGADYSGRIGQWKFDQNTTADRSHSGAPVDTFLPTDRHFRNDPGAERQAIARRLSGIADHGPRRRLHSRHRFDCAKRR